MGALHHASNEKIVKLLLNVFSKKEHQEKLIEYVMKENEYKETALHLASQYGYEEIVRLLLNVFTEEYKEKLIEYVMKENKFKNTALHYASKYEYEEIVRLLLNVSSKQESIEYVMKENQDKERALHYASHEKKIATLLLNTFSDEEKEKLIEHLIMKQNKYKKKTALHHASKYGHEEIVKLILNVLGKEDMQ